MTLISKKLLARDVQIRHQVDLMDMGEEGKVQVGNKSYRYILSVLDVFSRFVWLRAIQTKHSSTIAAKLKEIYQEHGPPRVVQSNQGSEFKGAVTQLCRDMNIKTIYSRPYHPQSQGKVERSHRSLREKMQHDHRMGNKGVNWAEELPNYQRILNANPKEVLCYKTPFEIYYTRKTNCFYKNTTNNKDELLLRQRKCNPTARDRKKHAKHAAEVRQKARLATERCNNRMKRYHLKLNPPSKYKVREKAYIRVPCSRGGIKAICKKQRVVQAIVEKRNLKRHFYKVSFISPVNQEKEKHWIFIDNIISLTLEEEREKQQAAISASVLHQRQKHWEKFFIRMSRDDYLRGDKGPGL